MDQLMTNSPIYKNKKNTLKKASVSILNIRTARAPPSTEQFFWLLSLEIVMDGAILYLRNKPTNEQCARKEFQPDLTQILYILWFMRFIYFSLIERALVVVDYNIWWTFAQTIGYFPSVILV